MLSALDSAIGRVQTALSQARAREAARCRYRRYVRCMRCARCVRYILHASDWHLQAGRLAVC